MHSGNHAAVRGRAPPPRMATEEDPEGARTASTSDEWVDRFRRRPWTPTGRRGRSIGQVALEAAEVPVLELCPDVDDDEIMNFLSGLEGVSPAVSTDTEQFDSNYGLLYGPEATTTARGGACVTRVLAASLWVVAPLCAACTWLQREPATEAEAASKASTVFLACSVALPLGVGGLSLVLAQSCPSLEGERCAAFPELATLVIALYLFAVLALAAVRVRFAELFWATSPMGVFASALVLYPRYTPPNSGCLSELLAACSSVGTLFTGACYVSMLSASVFFADFVLQGSAAWCSRRQGP